MFLEDPQTSFLSCLFVKNVRNEQEHTDWVALRPCLTCGHVGCCDSSKGMHTTKHFVNTTHLVIVALPDKLWKWCYVDKIY
jgi:uncharacterized UBP type Zn finger protein